LDSDDYFTGLLIQTHLHEPVISPVIVFAAVVLLLSVCGLLSAGERILLSLIPDEIGDTKEEKTSGDRLIRQLLEQPQQTLWSISILRSILHVTLVAVVIYGIPSSGQPAEGVFAVIGFIVFISVFFGILSGIIMRRNKSLRFIRWMAPWLKVIVRIFRPFTTFMASPEIAARKKASAGESAIISKESSDEKDMLEEIVHFYNKKADEIMVPRLDMEAVDIRCNFAEVMEVINRTGFSRIPVYEDTDDHIKGILYGKDLLRLIGIPDTFHWQSLIRPAYFVPETKKIDDLLEEFRSNKVHIAIVVDEFGCTSGLVTMEDIIEEIVGEISDEYDDDEKLFFTLPDGSYIFEGKIQLNDFFRETDIDAAKFGKLTEEVETLAGLMLEIKGTLPHRREVLYYNNYRFQILEADERRVLKIKFSVNEPPAKKKGS
jgi:gliding motility-associated protein GldE